MAKSFLSRYFKNSSLNWKLRFPTLLLATFLGLFGVYWIFENGVGSKHIQSVYNATRSSIYLTEAMNIKSDLSQGLKDLNLAFGSKNSLDEPQKVAELETLAERIDEILKRQKEEVAYNKDQSMNNEKLRSILGSLRSFLVELKEASTAKKLNHQVFEKKLREYSDLNKSFNGTVFRSIEQMRAEVIEIQTTNKRLETFSLAVILSVLVLSAFVVYLCMSLVSDISKELNEMSHMADVSNQVNYVSENIGLMGQALAERVSQQATALDESVSSMEEMSTMIAQTVKSTESALRDAESVQKESDEGLSVIQDLQRSMNDISASNVQLESIYEVIKQITSKTAIINEIVFETRLLSFNASIEAARAGQHGRGFAVVAEEVGNLAKMSGKAAQEIKELLDRSVTQVNKTVKDISERVKVGQKISVQCGNAFNTVSGSINKLTPMVNSIANAAREQETGIKQVNRALEQMESVTNKNAQSAEELASWATKLRAGSDSLMNEIDKLKKILFGMIVAVPFQTLTAKNDFSEMGGGKSSDQPDSLTSSEEGSHTRKRGTLHLVANQNDDQGSRVSQSSQEANVHELKSYRREVRLPKANDPRFK